MYMIYVCTFINICMCAHTYIYPHTYNTYTHNTFTYIHMYCLTEKYGKQSSHTRKNYAHVAKFILVQACVKILPLSIVL